MENKRKKRIVSLALAGILTSGLPAVASANTEFTVIEQTITNSDRYIVEKDDTLGYISEKLFGDSSYYLDLAKYNKIECPYTIYEGQVLKIPKDLLPLIKIEKPVIFPDDTIYVVEEGDILVGITEKVYGLYDQLTVDRLATYNNMEDPNQIYVDEVLQIPCIEKLNTIKPNDYSEKYKQMKWAINHQENNVNWYKFFNRLSCFRDENNYIYWNDFFNTYPEYLDEEKDIDWDEFCDTFPEYCENYLIQDDNCYHHIYVLKP